MVLVVLICSPGISFLSEEVEPDPMSLGKSGLVFVVFGKNKPECLSLVKIRPCFVVFGGILEVSGTAWDTR
ncbi:hypothetical protein R0J87_15500 [Halomonas sp. SIMBA_159]